MALENFDTFELFKNFDNKYNIQPEDIESGNFSPTDNLPDFSIIVRHEPHVFVTIEDSRLEPYFDTDERQFMVMIKDSTYHLYDCCTKLEDITHRSQEVGCKPPYDPPVFIYYATKLIDKFLERLENQLN